MELTAILLTAAALAGKAALSQAAKDAYQKLKQLLIRKSGQKAELEPALAGLEMKPESQSRRNVFEKELKAAGVGKDPDILQLARQLKDILKQEGHPVQVSYQANQSGGGAIAQGPGAVAAGKGGIAVGGNLSGGIRTGNKKDGSLEPE